MANKDKFKKMQQGGGVPGSFQDMVAQATTVAAIEQQAGQTVQQQTGNADGEMGTSSPAAAIRKPSEPLRFMRLPNPQIPITEYNLVTRCCEQFSNMTRQDFVELAIIEKLHNENIMPDEDFNARLAEIRNRPPRGHRKGTKNK